MERRITSKLKKWKESPSRKPLLLKGARQVRKTYLLKNFGKSEYDKKEDGGTISDPTVRISNTSNPKFIHPTRQDPSWGQSKILNLSSPKSSFYKESKLRHNFI